MSHFIIIGAGQAGASLSAQLRISGFQGRVTLIGDEPVPPYQRPPLSKSYLTGSLDFDRLCLRPPAFYAERGIDLLTGRRVTGLDAANRRVTLDDGTVMVADRIALTTGARAIGLPDELGGGLAGVFRMRTLADADALAKVFLPGRHVLIIGGGYIGLEAAAVAVKAGLRVTLIERASRILSRVACSETADWFRRFHRGYGVAIREATSLRRLVGQDGRLVAAELDDGSLIGADLAILGIGVQPETALATAAGLKTDNGIAVDSFGRTSVPEIYAAGDCCSFPHAGRRIRLESVPHAIDHAEAVAAAMLDCGAAYTARPWFWSDQHDVKLQIAGLSHGYDRVIVRPAGPTGRGEGCSHWYYGGSRLLAVDAINDATAFMTARRLIGAGLSPCADLVRDPAIPLKQIAAAPATATI